MSRWVTQVRYDVVLTHSDLVGCSLSQQPFVQQQLHMLQLLASASHHNTGVGQRPVGGRGRGRGGRGGRKVNDLLSRGSGEGLWYLDVCLGINLMHSITRGASGLVVQVIALDKHTVFTHTANPYLSLVLLIQDDSCCAEERRKDD